MDGTLIEDVNTYKYLSETLKYDGVSDNELRIRLDTATSIMMRLDNKYRTIKYHFSCEIQSIQVTNLINTVAKLEP